MKQTLFETRWLGVYRIGHWDFVQRPNADAAVGVLAITDNSEVILVEQFRIPLQRRTIEVPAGLVGDEDAHRGEGLGETARRELLEETGFDADHIEALVSSPTSAGMTSEYTHLFLARGLKRVGPGGGVDNEDIQVHLVPLDSIRQWLKNAEGRGAAVDFKIHAALWAAGIR